MTASSARLRWICPVLWRRATRRRRRRCCRSSAWETVEKEEKALYDERTQVGRIANQKAKYAQGLASYPDAPEEPVSAAELIRQQQEILTRNARRLQWRREYDAILAERDAVDRQIEETETRLRDLRTRSAELEKRAAEAEKTPKEMEEESTAELEAQLKDVEAINRKVEENRRRALAEDEAAQYQSEYDALTVRIEDVRARKMALLDGAELPLPGLSVEDGALTFGGRRWDCMSSSEHFRFS